MQITIDTLTPKGVTHKNTFTTDVSYSEVKQYERRSEADGLVDQNKIFELSNMSITNILVDAKRSVDFSVSIDKPAIEINCLLTHNSVYNFADLKGEYLVPKMHYSIVYAPNANYNNIWEVGNNQQLVHFVLDPQFILPYIPKHKALEDFFDDIANKKVSVLGNKSFPITAKMLHVIKKITDHSENELFQRMYIESAVIELVMLQLNQITQTSSVSANTPINNTLLSKIKDAKLLIENSFENPCSLIDLAHKVGTNENSLKKAFKNTYGTTVFGYITEMRMNFAKDLLLKEGLNVNEVASKLGYNDSTNFTASFKKYFGVTPGKLLK